MNRSIEFLSAIDGVWKQTIPDEVMERAKRSLLDYLAVTCAGAEFQKDKLNQYWEFSQPEEGKFRAIGTGKDLVDYLENTVKVGEICKDWQYAARGPEETKGPAVAITIDDTNKKSRFAVPFAHFNKEGKWVRWGQDENTENIDVAEQAALNTISMWQDQVRMYGDELSTDAQLMTTKMEQYIQNVNSSLTTCTQAVKAVGDLCKAITQNIR